MDIFKLSQTLETLIYDFMMWVIFYPYTLFLVIFRPSRMLDYVAAEVDKVGDPDRFDRGLSPPLFLLLSIILGWILAPDISSSFKQMGDGVLGEAIGDSSFNLLLVRLITFCAFPLAGGLIHEWRTPGGVTRLSFRKPFFQQAYLCSPFALTFSLGFVILGFERDQLRIGMTVLFLLLCLSWFIWAQSIFYRREVGAAPLSSFGWATLSVALGASVYALSFLMM